MVRVLALGLVVAFLPGCSALELAPGPATRALASASAAFAEGGASLAQAVGPSTPEAIFQATNALRAREGLTPLRWDPQLSAPADLHTTEMAKLGFFSHQGAAGDLVMDRFQRFGLGRSKAGENLYQASEFRGAEQVVGAWARSPGHLKNLLGDFGRSAIALRTRPDGQVWVTQVFSD